MFMRGCPWWTTPMAHSWHIHESWHIIDELHPSYTHEWMSQVDCSHGTFMIHTWHIIYKLPPNYSHERQTLVAYTNGTFMTHSWHIIYELPPSYTHERQTLVDYSHGIGVDAMNWISKPPGKLPPSTNIVRTFDYYSWLMIAVSLFAVWWVFNDFVCEYLSGKSHPRKPIWKTKLAISRMIALLTSLCHNLAEQICTKAKVDICLWSLMHWLLVDFLKTLNPKYSWAQ